MAGGEPLWLVVVVAALGSGGLLGGVAALVQAAHTNRLGVKGNELQAREDELTAEDRLIGRMEARISAEAERADRAEARAEKAEARYAAEREYTEALRRHIWSGGGWPPPERKATP